MKQLQLFSESQPSTSTFSCRMANEMDKQVYNYFLEASHQLSVVIIIWLSANEQEKTKASPPQKGLKIKVLQIQHRISSRNLPW